MKKKKTTKKKVWKVGEKWDFKHALNWVHTCNPQFSILWAIPPTLFDPLSRFKNYHMFSAKCWKTIAFKQGI